MMCVARGWSFPEETEGRASVELLGQLGPEARDRLRDLARDEVTSLEGGTYIGLRPGDVDSELQKHGLATQARVRTDGDYRVVSRLTEAGAEAARVLTGLGEIPAWARGFAEDEEQRDNAASQADEDIRSEPPPSPSAG